MAPVTRLFTVSALLVAAAAAAAAAQPLKPEWSRPVGGRARLVGVEEYGRCSVFVDGGAVQVVAPSGDISWTWPFSKISKYMNPRDVAVSHECDAIALLGDASYKYVWIVDKAGTSASIKFMTTPADVEFDRTGTLVAVGTYAGSLYLYSRNGALQWERPTKAGIVQGVEFADDNQRIRFKDWSGSGVVRVADHAASVLATIHVAPDVRRVKVSRDFGQVLIVTEKDLHPVSVESYEVPAPCRQ